MSYHEQFPRLEPPKPSEVTIPPKSVAAPAPQPQSREWYDLSGLERAFEIEDPLFHEYITLRDTSHTSPPRLREYGEGMADHDHPVVRQAAGWAFAEAAMYRRRSGKRLQDSDIMYFQDSLFRAESLWTDAAADLMTRATAGPDPKGSYLGAALRSKLALALVPAMRLVTDMRCGLQPSRDDIEEEVRAARKSVLELGIDFYQNWNVGDMEQKTARHGVAAEAVGYVILQDYRREGSEEQPPFIIVPASMRQDNNDRVRLRSDLVSFHPEGRYKSLIQITSETRRQLSRRLPEGAQNTARFMVHVRPDLCINHKGGVDSTLGALLVRELGEAEPDVTTRLDAMTNELGAKLAVFKNSP